MVDWEIVRKLINIVKEEEISGLSIEEKGVKYEVRRDAAGGISSSHVMPAPVPAAPAAAPAAASQVEDDGLVAITSPMVGTFYRAPSPESPAFVETGDDVAPGKVVCIVEAMKLFNEIEAEVSGKVAKILVENGQPVEYGQKLMLVKKA